MVLQGGKKVVLVSCKKAQISIFLLLMIGVVFFILGLALTPILSQTIGEATSTSQLNCSNSSISDQDKAVCTSLDIQSFLFFGTILGLGSMLLTKIIL